MTTAIDTAALGDLIPLPAGAKMPVPAGVTGYEGDSTYRPEWDGHTGNWGLRLRDGVIGLDIDGAGHGEGKQGPEGIAALEADLGPLPAGPYSTRHGENADTHIRVFRVPEGSVLSEKVLKDIEIIQRHHRYMCVAPSRLDDGTEYAWYDSGLFGPLSEAPALEDVPALPEAWLEHLKAADNLDTPRATSDDVESFLATIPNRKCGPVTDAAIDRSLTEEGRDKTLTRKLRRVLLAAREDGGREAVDDFLEALEEDYALEYTGAEAERAMRRGLEAVIGRIRAEEELEASLDAPEGPDAPEAEDKVLERARAIVFERTARRMADDMEADDIELEVLSSDDLRSIPSPEHIVDGLLYQDTLAVWAGTGSVGKTATLIGIALAMGNRIDFLGLPVRQGRVLFLEAEGVSSLQHRIDSWNKGLGMALNDDHIDWIKVKKKMTPAILKKVRDLHEKNRYDLVVIDTMSSVFAVESENDNAEVSRLMSALKNDVRDAVPGTCVVLVHHTTNSTDKSGNRTFKARGASAYRDDADTVVIQHGDAISQSISTEPGDAGKQRDAAPTAMRGLCLREAGKSVYVAHQADEDRARADLRTARFLFVLRDGPLGSEAWQTASGFRSKQTYQEIRSEVLGRGFAEKEGGSRSPYALTPAGQDFIDTHL